MNKAIRIIAGLGVLAALASCSQKAEFTTNPYVALTTTSVNVPEDAGSISIPVSAFGLNAEGYTFPNPGTASTSITFEVIEGTASLGEDFTVTPANGVLSIEGATEGSITINVVNMPGEYTGNKNFTIRLTGASNGFELGSMTEVSVVIADNDHPLSAILTTYTGISYENWDGDVAWTASFSPDPDDTSVVWISGFAPMTEGYAAADVYGIVSDDLTTITIPLGQNFANGSYTATWISLTDDGSTVLTEGELVLQAVQYEDGSFGYAFDNYYGIGAYSGADFQGWFTLLYGCYLVMD